MTLTTPNTGAAAAPLSGSPREPWAHAPEVTFTPERERDVTARHRAVRPSLTPTLGLIRHPISRRVECLDYAGTVQVAGFTAWYNGVHLHSGIRFVTPDARHAGKDAAILARRHAVYEAAKAKNPGRWTSSTRNWTPVDEVYLNPAKHQSKRSNETPLGRPAA